MPARPGRRTLVSAIALAATVGAAAATATPAFARHQAVVACAARPCVSAPVGSAVRSDAAQTGSSAAFGICSRVARRGLLHSAAGAITACQTESTQDGNETELAEARLANGEGVLVNANSFPGASSCQSAATSATAGRSGAPLVLAGVVSANSPC